MHEHQYISEYPAIYFESIEWANRLAGWCSMCGVNNIPDKITQEFIVSFLQDEYKSHAFEEVDLAIRMYVAGDLDDNLEAYNNFNIRFLSKVMMAYRRKRKAIANKFEEIKFQIEKPAPVIPTEKETDLTVMQIIWEDYVRIVNKVTIDPWSYKCDLLLKYNLVLQERVDSMLEQCMREITKSLEITGNKDERKKIENTIASAELMFIAATTKAKGYVYKGWLHTQKSKKKTFTFFEDIANSLILGQKNDNDPEVE